MTAAHTELAAAFVIDRQLARAVQHAQDAWLSADTLGEERILIRELLAAVQTMADHLDADPSPADRLPYHFTLSQLGIDTPDLSPLD